MSNYDGLSAKHTEVLLDLLENSSLARRPLIEKRYREQAVAFETTLHFLKSMKIVKEDRGNLEIITPSRFSNDKSKGKWRDEILEVLIGTHSSYRKELIDYIQKYRVEDGEVEYRPQADTRAAESSLRNFLLDLGVLSYDRPNDRYVLCPEHLDLYALALQPKHPKSLAAFRHKLHSNEKVGYCAELAVLEFERLRVGKPNAEKVEHTALKNVSAGYDIRSLTIGQTSYPIPRYVEVKAVSMHDYQFFWTANEVEVASILAPWYYLYLLPVKRDGEFALEELRIISDPCREIITDSGDWLVEKNCFRCSLKRD